MELNKTELKDLDWILEKIINSTPFYALEISKVKYLFGRIKEIKKDSEQKIKCPGVVIERAALCSVEGIRAVCGTDEEYSEYVKKFSASKNAQAKGSGE